MDEAEARTPAPSRPGMVERLTLVLDAFATGPDHLLLEEVAARAGLPRSTSYRLLAELTRMRWLEHGPHGYALGPRAHRLGRRVQSSVPLRAAAAGALHELHAATSAVVHLTVLEGGSVEVLDKVGGLAGSDIPSAVGTRYRAEDAVAGRAMLAALAPEQVDRLLAGGRASSDLHRRLHAIRQRRGLAITSDDMPWDLRGVGAAIVGPDGPVGAISVGLPGRSAPVERFVPMLARAVRITSRRLLDVRHDAERFTSGL
ncbi:IclR family transcriptional regulator [Nocardioides sp. zg-DK7169]|uniref:IclR family transcriptional regulator n=1 Tax=Nocardioides sp. zg-DK7169 TaxID=2736600 RepID=UPI00155401AF|nr:IclR family transcriptional regulator [Nocardioides sp. zg-DK7169]NPC97342.1 IclR family transcriptional regulator [Nocardioides sp. zg-DK7169]